MSFLFIVNPFSFPVLFVSFQRYVYKVWKADGTRTKSRNCVFLHEPPLLMIEKGLPVLKLSSEGELKFM
jgi:hypothetical protein